MKSGEIIEVMMYIRKIEGKYETKDEKKNYRIKNLDRI